MASIFERKNFDIEPDSSGSQAAFQLAHGIAPRFALKGNENTLVNIETFLSKIFRYCPKIPLLADSAEQLDRNPLANQLILLRSSFLLWHVFSYN
jgi:hypothetical protein